MPRLNDAELIELRRTHLGRLLLEAARDFQQRTTDRLHAAGYEDYKLTHNALMTNLGLEGARLGQLAERAGMTKQSMQAIADELESLGYIVREADPTDRRARLIRFSQRGRGFLDNAGEIFEAVIAEYSEIAGVGRVERLKNDLRVLVDGLGVELP